MIKRLIAMSLCAIAALSASAAATIVNIAENETRELAPSAYGNGVDTTIMVAAAGSTIVLPKGSANLAFYPHLVVSGGVVRVTCKDGSTYSRYRFVSGVRSVLGGSLVVDGAPEITVDRQSVDTSKLMPATGPLCDIDDVTFTASNPKGLLLRFNATVRSLPSTCPVKIESGCNVALACETDDASAPIRDGNSISLTNFNVIALSSGALPSGCNVRVSPNCKFTFKPVTLSSDGLSWTPAGTATGGYDVQLLGKGAIVEFANHDGMSIRCISNVRGVGEVQFKPEAGKGSPYARFRGQTYRVGASGGLVIPVDDVAYPIATTSDAWKSKVSHWFDASDGSTLIPFEFDPTVWDGNWASAVNEYDGHQLVVGWKDKVEGSTISLYNQRLWNKVSKGDYSGMKSDYVLQVLPYFVANGLNGMNYLCCGSKGGSRSGAKYDKDGNLATASENRRLRVWNSANPSGSQKPSSGNYSTFQAAYCIMVFGSQQGGGQAIVGTGTDDTSLSSALVRGGTKISHAWMTNSHYKVHVDGNYVNATSDTPNGGWQIVSIDMSEKDTLVNGLGSEAYNDSNCGGQNYAEVIFFSEKPTVDERKSCEQYLANKWGLFCTDWDGEFACLAGSSGTTFLGNQTADGYVEDDGADEIKARGFCREGATIDIPAGRTLLLDRPLPPTEADVPDTNRVGWFDPEFEGALAFDGDYGYPDLLNRLYGRTATALLNGDNNYMFSSGNRSGTTGNFAPRVVESVRGALTTGPSRKWMVFKETHNDGVGNMIRRRKVGNGETGGMNSVSIRQGFFVTDTTDGGGDLFGDNHAFANGKIKPRKGNVVSDPIWSPSNTMAMASTWLDTTAVDGTVVGYSGRPEVLSFTTESSYDIGYVANWAGTNTEVVGEYIFYSQPLDDAARTKVQEYLMYKWFGDLNGKYADYSGATVTGAGTVKSPTLRNLPKFGQNFTGAVAGGSELSFTVGTDGVADALAIGRRLVLDDGATVTVNVSGKPAAGHHTLLMATSISGSATPVIVGLPANRTAKLHVDTNEIWLEVIAPGMVFIVR